jgi:hypothetical protein
MNSLQKKLHRLGACQGAIDWLGDRDAATAWRECQRGDWMLWILGRLAGPPMSEARRPLVLAACECARLGLPHVPKHETRSLAAIELAERWAKGDELVTERQLRKAAYGAYTAADVAYTDAYLISITAASAASAAAAADAAYAASAASAATATASEAAAYAASARGETLARCADIVRKHYPTPPVLP